MVQEFDIGAKDNPALEGTSREEGKRDNDCWAYALVPHDIVAGCCSPCDQYSDEEERVKDRTKIKEQTKNCWNLAMSVVLGVQV